MASRAASNCVQLGVAANRTSASAFSYGLQSLLASSGLYDLLHVRLRDASPRRDGAVPLALANVGRVGAIWNRRGVARNLSVPKNWVGPRPRTFQTGVGGSFREPLGERACGDWTSSWSPRHIWGQLHLPPPGADNLHGPVQQVQTRSLESRKFPPGTRGRQLTARAQNGSAMASLSC